MGSTLTVAEAARLIGRSTEATRKLIDRYGIEKVPQGNGHNVKVRLADIMRAAQKSEAR
jgi:hypothetical protein